MIHGLLIVHKERGMTSHQVVARLRGILGQSGIGHTGTLDPEATGVLVIGLGEATKAFQFLDETDKQYRAQIILGQATDTQDATGEVTGEAPAMQVDSAEIDRAIRTLVGEVEQVPPMYSAVKVQGQKLYDLARQGLEVERKSRRITVWDWEVQHFCDQYEFRGSFQSTITCSKGTYIRTLIHDLGQQLGCYAHMGSLVRIRSGNFELKEALTLAQIETEFRNGALSGKLIPMHRALAHLPSVFPDDSDRQKLVNGGKLSNLKYPMAVKIGSLAKAMDATLRVIAVLELKTADSHCYWQPVKVFRY